jgi:demethylmenaquinone methyltransferase/2-methoxy-6-polyprenyl-1,4-benzoquinol methylase
MKLFRLYRVDEIIRHLKPKKHHRVLDLGGGTGHLARLIAPLVDRVSVLDSSEKMLRQAARYPHLDLCHARAQEIPYPDNYFDAIICTDALHHIKDIDKAVSEITRVLKKNGKIVVLEFHIQGWRGALFWLFEKIYIDNSRFIKPESLRWLLASWGFEGDIIPVSAIEYLYSGEKQW